MLFFKRKNLSTDITPNHIDVKIRTKNTPHIINNLCTTYIQGPKLHQVFQGKLKYMFLQNLMIY